MKTQNPWMGRARGSAGNMTSSKVYDKNVMRAKAFEVNNPKTAAQTTERNFFAFCQNMATKLSEEQLRSLFGIKPKSKSRRNALLGQLLQANQTMYGQKNFIPSFLKAIGNGSKVSTPFFEEKDLDQQFEEEINVQMFGANANESSLVYMVYYNGSGEIGVVETGFDIGGMNSETAFDEINLPNDLATFSGYLTIAEDGSSESRPFGSFKLKTRAV